MSANEFYEKMKDYSDPKILSIFKKLSEYQPEAQVAVKKVALERNLIDKDLTILIENFDEEAESTYLMTEKDKKYKFDNAVSLRLRIFNFLIDAISVYILMIFAVFVLKSLRLDFFLPRDGRLIYLIFYLLYFFLSESIFDQTIGKFFTKTKVVNKYMVKPTMPQLLIRSISRLIPFEPFSFFGKKPLGWHDTLSKTYVVFH
jgi:uncharacterized RDD family membrane protein YckC